MTELAIPGLQPVHTFECGQCFRWTADGQGAYTGIASGRVCRVVSGAVQCEEKDRAFWKDYFRTDMDYAVMQAQLIRCAPELERCIRYGSGIRILHQDLWETTVSFILSANNNIPRIRRIIETLCSRFGKAFSALGTTWYSFPDPELLAGCRAEDLGPLRAGYRTPYVLDAARRFAGGDFESETFRGMDTQEAGRRLMEIKGVGSKVADCILLFALNRFDVFPKDVWIKRTMAGLYGVSAAEADAFAAERYGAWGGLAQQYLFYYYRDHAWGDSGSGDGWLVQNVT